ncbi:tigger transposable element-derived protein 6-like [Octopus sinensis]|uniref:Tigger transposable element-derived protein 6-like n=1 Tax=Octopus sinensis TaxID=2607531 RepID=A0A6P7TZ67_9MOLL|nr:tigger transposable element-derived protein 6-like [Octopus sinensis]
MTGTDKLTPFIIGKFKNPRCFKNFSYRSFVTYHNSKKAWMDSKLFNTFLFEWDIRLAKEKRKILLVIDQCPSHKIFTNLQQIEIMFLPANATCLLQPMDQGVIKTFKTLFNKFKFLEIIEKIELGKSSSEAFFCFSIALGEFLKNKHMRQNLRTIYAYCFEKLSPDRGLRWALWTYGSALLQAREVGVTN